MDKWFNDIRDSLKDYGQEPPQGLWEQLSTRLEQDGLAGKRKHKSAAWMLWPRRIAVAACIAVAVLAGYRYMPDFTQAPELASVGEKNTTGKAAEIIEQSGQKAPETDSPHQFIAQNGSMETAASAPEASGSTNARTLASAAGTDAPIMTRALAGTAQSTLMTKTESQQTALASIPSHEEETAEATAMASVEAKEPVADAVEQDRTGEKPVALKHADPSARMGRSVLSNSSRTQQARTAPTHTNSTRLALSAQATGLAGSAISSRGISGFPVVSLGPDDATWIDNPVLGMAVFNQGKMVERKVHHRLPVQVGIGVSYDLNSHLALGSGLTYTHLRSDLREGTAANYQKSVQSLHYMGLPINLKYTFLRTKGLSLYAQAGALAEVRVSGKRTTHYTLDHQRSGEDTERINSHPLQMSVNLAAGAQYNITPTLALYAEPGVSHHFKDNSSVPTIYEDKPTNFSLNVGVRLCLSR